MIRSGLLGRAILASRSPWLHEQEAAALGHALRYDLFDFTDRGWADDRLAAVLHDLAAQGYAGVNVTYPFKQQVIGLVDDLADSAIAAGAVNTIAMRDGRMTGHNTDMAGFAQSLISGLPGVALEGVLQLGAGGAGSAVAGALLSLGVSRLLLTDPDPARATALAARLNQWAGSGRVEVVAGDALDTATVDGIVNASPVGMAALPGLPLAADLVTARHWVADIIYFPIETELLALARRRGCRAINGAGMVVAQAALAFEIITGLAADKDRVAASFDAFEPAAGE